VLERERHRLILKLVDERSIISIGQLVELLNASDATIRRDINALAEQGQLRRVRGGAESVQPRFETHLAGIPFSLSQGMNAAAKRDIARAACEMIEPGDSIIIGGGSTAYGMVEFLPPTGLDILTNSFPIAATLIENSRNRITLPGGTYYKEQRIILSPFETDAIGNYSADKLFTGCLGISRLGLMETDPLVARALTRLLTRTEKVIVVADASKLRNRSAMIVFGLDRIDTLITDEGASAAELDAFRTAGVQVIVAHPIVESPVAMPHEDS
jgi:DeoR family ulaG and ulaABCDEF operon transcriptional repressor